MEPFLSSTHSTGDWDGWGWDQEEDTFRLYNLAGKLHLTFDRRAGYLTYQDQPIPRADLQALRRQITTDDEGDRLETLWLDTAARCWELISGMKRSDYAALAKNLGQILDVPVVEA